MNEWRKWLKRIRKVKHTRHNQRLNDFLHSFFLFFSVCRFLLIPQISRKNKISSSSLSTTFFLFIEVDFKIWLSLLKKKIFLERIEESKGIFWETWDEQQIATHTKKWKRTFLHLRRNFRLRMWGWNEASGFFDEIWRKVWLWVFCSH
jgi:hypothetical protein